MTDTTQPPWREVLAFWFPEGLSPDVDAETHRRHWAWRMHGGADAAIATRFAELTTRAAEGALKDWASDPEGRLALIILLDQFSRSVWRGTARAWAQDEAALALALEGLENGHYTALAAPWFQIVFTQPLGHAEGPGHLERVDQLIRLREAVAAGAPEQLRPIYDGLVVQAGKVRRVIETFGRHPHRNAILGRPASPAEAAYVASGDFPHDSAFKG